MILSHLLLFFAAFPLNFLKTNELRAFLLFARSQYLNVSLQYHDVMLRYRIVSSQRCDVKLQFHNVSLQYDDFQQA